MRDVIVKVTTDGTVLEHGYATPGPDGNGDMVYIVKGVPDGVSSGEIVLRFGATGGGFGAYEIPYAALAATS